MGKKTTRNWHADFDRTRRLNEFVVITSYGLTSEWRQGKNRRGGEKEGGGGKF